jgi:Rieske Fe-S protein
MTRDELLLKWLKGADARTRRDFLRFGGLGAAALLRCGASTSGGQPITGQPTGGARSTRGTSGGQAGSTSAGGTTGTTGGMVDAGPFDAGIPPSCSPQPCPADANTLIVPLKDYPDLNQVGGSHTFFDPRYVDPICSNDNLIVIQPAAGMFVSLSASCTHMCCVVSLVDGKLECPCHSSQFDLSGNVIAGPASRPLPTIPTCFDGCTVFVQLAD